MIQKNHDVPNNSRYRFAAIKKQTYFGEAIYNEENKEI